MTSSDSLDLDELFELLKNRRRRYVLYYLSSGSGRAEFDELVRELAEWEAGADATDVDRARKEHIRTALHHLHLPKLSEAGIVAVSPDRNRVELDEVGAVELFIDDLAYHDGVDGFVSGE